MSAPGALGHRIDMLRIWQGDIMILNTFYLQLYGRKEGNVLFNNANNTFNSQLYGIRKMVKDPSDSMRLWSTGWSEI